MEIRIMLLNKKILLRIHSVLYDMWIKRHFGYLDNVHFVYYIYLINFSANKN